MRIELRSSAAVTCEQANHGFSEKKSQTNFTRSGVKKGEGAVPTGEAAIDADSAGDSWSGSEVEVEAA